MRTLDPTSVDASTRFLGEPVAVVRSYTVMTPLSARSATAT